MQAMRDDPENQCEKACHRFDQSLDAVLVGNYHDWNAEEVVHYTPMVGRDLMAGGSAWFDTRRCANCIDLN